MSMDGDGHSWMEGVGLIISRSCISRDLVRSAIISEISAISSEISVNANKIYHVLAPTLPFLFLYECSPIHRTCHRSLTPAHYFKTNFTHLINWRLWLKYIWIHGTYRACKFTWLAWHPHILLPAAIFAASSKMVKIYIRVICATLWLVKQAKIWSSDLDKDLPHCDNLRPLWITW